MITQIGKFYYPHLSGGISLCHQGDFDVCMSKVERLADKTAMFSVYGNKIQKKQMIVYLVLKYFVTG